MGSLTTFFGALQREGKAKLLERILVVVDEGSQAAGEAMTGMLEVYYSEAQEKNAEKVLPFVNILDISAKGGEESKCRDRKASWMEYTKISLEETEGENSTRRERIGLIFDKGRILKTSVISSGSEVQQSWEKVLGCFPTDSRGEARSILLGKMVTLYAKDNNYDLILYCDTATKIASKVLALTSQGRGFSLPWECGSLFQRNGSPLPPWKKDRAN
jgi:hypothetical protein